MNRRKDVHVWMGRCRRTLAGLQLVRPRACQTCAEEEEGAQLGVQRVADGGDLQGVSAARVSPGEMGRTVSEQSASDALCQSLAASGNTMGRSNSLGAEAPMTLGAELDDSASGVFAGAGFDVVANAGVALLALPVMVVGVVPLGPVGDSFVVAFSRRRLF